MTPSPTETRETGEEPSAQRLRLLVSLPALDEEKTIGDVIARIPRDIPNVEKVDVVVVDDGSEDGTREKARAAGAHVIRHSTNRGVGAAFHSILAYGLEHGADLIVTIDSDGQFDPKDIPELIGPVLRDEADFTTASRFKDPALVPEMSWVKRWGNRMMSLLISHLAGQELHDVSCGMRCYSRAAALQLHLVGHFTYTQEVFLNLVQKHLRIVEVPIRVRGRREFGESRVANNLFRYAGRTSLIIFRCYRDYYPLRFFGAIAAVLAAGSFALAAFFVYHYFTTGGFSPHLWAGFVSAALLAFSALSLQAGMIGDMMTRQRCYLEELLLYQRMERRRDRDRCGAP